MLTCNGFSEQRPTKCSHFDSPHTKDHTPYRVEWGAYNLFLLLLNVQAGLDRVKWIDGDDCLSEGITGEVGDLGKLTDFDLAYSQSTGFTVQTVAFPETEIGGPYPMCCEYAISTHVN